MKSALSDPKTQPWPMGDLMPAGGPPANLDMTKVREAVDAAFDPAGMTAAFVVTYKGQIIAERYGEHITPTTPLESWSMGKSLSGTLMGILMQQGVYILEQPAPIPEWQTPGDPRAKIRIMDILHMSSGLRIIAPQDPDYDEKGPYPDHFAGNHPARVIAARSLWCSLSSRRRFRRWSPIVRKSVEWRRSGIFARRRTAQKGKAVARMGADQRVDDPLSDHWLGAAVVTPPCRLLTVDVQTPRLGALKVPGGIRFFS